MKDYRASFEDDRFYHLFNHAVGGDNIIQEEKNYEFFLSRFAKYMVSNVNVYAYCVLPNHFHFVFQVNAKRTASISDLLKYFFTSYTNSVNKVYQRRGSLFEPRVKRIAIDSEQYLRECIRYVHRNPVQHGFVDDPALWNYSSFNTILNKNTISTIPVEVEKVLDLFGDLPNFVHCHCMAMDGIEEFE